MNRLKRLGQVIRRARGAARAVQPASGRARPEFTAGTLCHASPRVPALLIDATRSHPSSVSEVSRHVVTEQALTGGFRPVWLVTTEGHGRVRWTGHPIEVIDYAPRKDDELSQRRFARRMHQLHATYEPWAELTLGPDGFSPGQLAYLRAFSPLEG